MLKLSARGASLVSEWLAGQAEPVSPAQRQLMWHLVESGMVSPPQPSPGSIEPTDVIIPVYDDPVGLAFTLAGLAHDDEGLNITVVDDGSPTSVELPDWAAGRVALIRSSTNGGPATARTVGITATENEIVVFVDAGVRITPKTVRALAAWCTKTDGIVAAGPRIVVPPPTGPLDRYEASHSVLDVGRGLRSPEIVGPGRPVGYLPTAALAVRRQALEAIDGFDPRFRYGEDVDLVWRLDRIGSVVVDPALSVTHPARATIIEFMVQRFRYGTSAGLLAAKHGRTMAPFRVDRAVAVALVGSIVLPLVPATAVAVGTVVLETGRRAAQFRTWCDGTPGSAARGAIENLRSTAQVTVAFTGVAGRAWWPITLIAVAQARSPRLRARARGIALGWLIRNAAHRDLGAIAIAVLDDLSYGIGVWYGSLRARTARALVPTMWR